MDKICKKCGATKPVSEFPKNKATPDGLDAMCKTCVREKNRAQYAKHAEKRRASKRAENASADPAKKAAKAAYQKAYQAAHRDDLNAYSRQYRLTHTLAPRSDEQKERNRIRMNQRYATDLEFRERVKQARRDHWASLSLDERRATNDSISDSRLKWRKAHANDYYRERRPNDPEFRAQESVTRQMYRLRQWAKNDGESTWVRHIENQTIDPAHRHRLFAWQDGRCYICNRKVDKLTIEHLVPRSRGGPTVKQNIVFSCEDCNYRRQARTLCAEWVPPFVESCPDFFVNWRTVEMALAGAGLNPTRRDDGGFNLHTGLAPDRAFYVLSTFSGSDRNPGSDGGRVACAVKEADSAAIVILDHEWYGRQNAVLNMLKAKLGVSQRGPGARELTIDPYVDASDAKQFLDEHHVMGAVNALIYIGLRDEEGVLYAVGAFTRKNRDWDCVRLAFRGHVAGGMSRIMQALWRCFGRRDVVSFVDTRYAVGDGHEVIGFQRVGTSPSTYMWVFPDRIQHQRYLSNDNKRSRGLLYYNFDLSADINIKANGIYKIWIPPKLKLRLKALD